MPLSPEHLAAMAAGRKKAKERREAEKIAAQGADATNIPAGHKRDEQIRKNADAGIAKQELRHEDVGVEAIDAAKLHKKPDNEAMRYYEEQRRKRFNQVQAVEGAQPGWRYSRMKLPGTCAGEDAKSAVRSMMAAAKLEGWIPVQENDSEDEKYKGNDCAAGTSLRGVMDTVLMKQREEDGILMDRAQAAKAKRQGAVEERTILLAQQKGLGEAFRGVAGEFSQDPEMARRFAPDQRSSVVMRSTFDEGDIRRGSIPGMPIGDNR